MEIISGYAVDDCFEGALMLLKGRDLRFDRDIMFCVLLQKKDTPVISDKTPKVCYRKILEEMSYWFYSKFIKKYYKYNERQLPLILKRILEKTIKGEVWKNTNICAAICFENELVTMLKDWDGVYRLGPGLLRNCMENINLNETGVYSVSLDKNVIIMLSNEQFVMEYNRSNLAQCFDSFDVSEDGGLIRRLNEVKKDGQAGCAIAFVVK